MAASAPARRGSPVLSRFPQTVDGLLREREALRQQKAEITRRRDALAAVWGDRKPWPAAVLHAYRQAGRDILELDRRVGLIKRSLFTALDAPPERPQIEGLEVSEHAIMRYLTRVAGINMQVILGPMRDWLNGHDLPRDGVSVIDEHAVVVRSGIIITILPRGFIPGRPPTPLDAGRPNTDDV